MQFELNQAVNLRFSAKQHKCSVMRTPFFLQTIKRTLTPCILTKLHSCREFAQSLHRVCTQHRVCTEFAHSERTSKVRAPPHHQSADEAALQPTYLLNYHLPKPISHQHQKLLPSSPKLSASSSARIHRVFQDLVESNGAHQTIFSCS